MQKMSALDLHFVAKELAELKGKRIAKIRRTQERIFLFKIGGKELLFEPPVRLHLTMQSFVAQPAPDGFVAFLRKRLEGKPVEDLFQHENDRIAVLQTKDSRLIFELFRKGNLILTDSNWEILACLNKEESKKRMVAKGQKYEFPENSSEFKLEIPAKPFFGVKTENGVPVAYSVEPKEGFIGFGSICEALDFYYSRQPRQTKEDRELAKRIEKLRERLEHQQRALAELEARKELAKESANSIYQHFDQVSTILEEVRQLKKQGLTAEQINEKIAQKKAKLVSDFEVEIEL
ncbi:MAG: NFACT family protein [Candidatus Micrarchaeota archaeon]|nr:NFACT family protein [Candidatus Micrarchaeota archaeon]